MMVVPKEYNRTFRPAWNCWIFKNRKTGFWVVIGKNWSLDRCIAFLNKEEASQ